MCIFRPTVYVISYDLFMTISYFHPIHAFCDLCTGNDLQKAYDFHLAHPFHLYTYDLDLPCCELRDQTDG